MEKNENILDVQQAINFAMDFTCPPDNVIMFDQTADPKYIKNKNIFMINVLKINFVVITITSTNL